MHKVSIIIPTLNEEKYIGNLLNSIRSQSYKDIEIIVVDSNSKDKTREIAKKFGAKVINIKKRGIGLARAIGAEKSKGEYLFFTDADAIFSKDIVKNYVEYFSSKDCVGATGPLKPYDYTSLSYRLFYDVWINWLVKTAIKLNFAAAYGSNLFVRRKEYFECGGINKNLNTSEDLDLARRISKHGKFCFIDDCVMNVSARRIKNYGILRYSKFALFNAIRFYISGNSARKYKPIR